MPPEAEEGELAQPTQPVYPLGQPGDDLLLFTGNLTIAGTPSLGRVWLPMTGDTIIRWALEPTEWRCVPLGETRLSFEHPQLGSLDLPVRTTSTTGRGSVVSTSVGAAVALDELVVHWAGLPWILPAEPLESRTATWSGRWCGTGGGWSFWLDVRQDHADVVEAARGTPRHVVTHVGVLRRSDRQRFSPSEAEEGLLGLQAAFSLALGRWVAPLLATGFVNDKRLWESWSAWRCEPMYPNYSWWDTNTGDDLRSFVGLIMDAWTDADRHDVVRHIVHHLIEANKPSTTMEARVMLAGAALEYLSWVTFVVGAGRPAKAHPGRASDKLRELLARAGIPPAIPLELEALAALGPRLPQDRPQDGPESVAWVRNRLVHPKDAREPYRLEHLVLQTCQLLMHYGELLLLHEVGYHGSYNRRFPLGQWAHDSTPVPWA